MRTAGRQAAPPAAVEALQSIAVAVASSNPMPIAALGLCGPTAQLVSQADSLAQLLHHEANRLEGGGGQRDAKFVCPRGGSTGLTDD
jgi:hypothetical protein